MDVWLTDNERIPVSAAQPVFTIKEAAAKLGASYAQVAGWLRSGTLAGFPIATGYFWRVPESALAAFVKPKRGRPKRRTGLGAACHSLDGIDTDRENDPAVDDAIHGLGEDGETLSGGAVLVGVLALLFALAVVALFRHWPVDIGWLFSQFGGGW
jgi:hypothetical protein